MLLHCRRRLCGAARALIPPFPIALIGAGDEEARASGGRKGLCSCTGSAIASLPGELRNSGEKNVETSERRGDFFAIFFRQGKGKLASKNCLDASAMRPCRPQLRRSAGPARIQAPRIASSWRNTPPMWRAKAGAAPSSSSSSSFEADGDEELATSSSQPQPQPQTPPPPPPASKGIERRGAKPGRIVSDETRSKMSRAKEGRVMPLGEFV
jgi:hypothetical protein